MSTAGKKVYSKCIKALQNQPLIKNDIKQLINQAYLFIGVIRENIMSKPASTELQMINNKYVKKQDFDKKAVMSAFYRFQHAYSSFKGVLIKTIIVNNDNEIYEFDYKAFKKFYENSQMDFERLRGELNLAVNLKSRGGQKWTFQTDIQKLAISQLQYQYNQQNLRIENIIKNIFSSDADLKLFYNGDKSKTQDVRKVFGQWDLRKKNGEKYTSINSLINGASRKFNQISSNFGQIRENYVKFLTEKYSVENSKFKNFMYKQSIEEAILSIGRMNSKASASGHQDIQQTGKYYGDYNIEYAVKSGNSASTAGLLSFYKLALIIVSDIQSIANASVDIEQLKDKEYKIDAKIIDTALKNTKNTLTKYLKKTYGGK